jgi:hypothetical protein
VTPLIKITPCSKGLRAEHMLKFCSLSPAMVAWCMINEKILERDIEQYIINHYKKGPKFFSALKSWNTTSD